MRYTACLPSRRKVEYLRKPKQHGTNKVSKQHLTSFLQGFLKVSGHRLGRVRSETVQSTF